MSKKVLIVDDSLVSRLMIKEIMGVKYPNWEFIQAASADKAIEACQQTQFDFITLEINMSGRSGLEAAPIIIKSQNKAKVALLTASNHASTIEQAKINGLEFIAKPINEDCILEFVELS